MVYPPITECHLRFHFLFIPFHILCHLGILCGMHTHTHTQMRVLPSKTFSIENVKKNGPVKMVKEKQQNKQPAIRPSPSPIPRKTAICWSPEQLSGKSQSILCIHFTTTIQKSHLELLNYSHGNNHHYFKRMLSQWEWEWEWERRDSEVDVVERPRIMNVSRLTMLPIKCRKNVVGWQRVRGGPVCKV